MDWAREPLLLLGATACGLLIGIERGFDLRRMREGTRVAGVRTFTLIGLIGGVAGFIGSRGQAPSATALLIGIVGILAIGYGLRSERADATTPIAALAAAGLGFMAGAGTPALAIAGATVVMLILAMREEARGFIGRLEEQDVKSLARFAVLALAILPFLPSGHYGPFGAWNPQRLWLVVVLVTGFSFMGYIANRLFGERHGTIATAAIGGIYSSTAVTQALAERLGKAERPGAEPAGIALATAVMYLRVTLLVGIIATRAVVPFAALVAPAFIVSLIAAWSVYRHAPTGDSAAVGGNPVALKPALFFAAFVAIAAVAAKWGESHLAQQGIAALLLVTGSTDVDTAVITVGGLAPGAISPSLAALALAGAVMANMAVKLGITIVNARGKGKSAALALGASMVALAISIAIGWLRLHH
jgi:uncharacterized membrane protein (DUF4010 family)